MDIVEQSAELVSMTSDPLFHAEKCSRICYKSEDKCLVTSYDQARKFVAMLRDKGHTSVFEHCYATFHLITDRGVSHELVRHRVGVGYSQESTRYIKYDNIKVIDPPDIRAMHECEAAYRRLINNGVSPQIARGVLPTCLKTEIIITANFRAWRTIIEQRYCNSGAHPKIRELIGLVVKRFMDDLQCRIFFEDLV